MVDEGDIGRTPIRKIRLTEEVAMTEEVAIGKLGCRLAISSSDDVESMMLHAVVQILF